MFLFGGLRPIWPRFVLDVVTISSLSASVACRAGPYHLISLLVPLLLTALTAGLTRRWPISFPLVPLLVLQQLRPKSSSSSSSTSWSVISIILTVLSVLLLVLMMVLCVAFPAVQPPQVHGPHKVGVVEVHLPIDLSLLEQTAAPQPSHVWARILYPTTESGVIPYLNPEIASEYLRQSIRTAAPPPISNWFWFLDNWKLVKIPVKRNATLLQTDTKFPVVAYSHGLGGSLTIYSHQTRTLAAHGYLVIAIDHTDGSCPVVLQKAGSPPMLLDASVVQLWRDKKFVEYAQARRDQTLFRAKQLVGAAVAMMELTERTISELPAGLSFVGKLDTTSIHAMGHSFGGVTALTAAFERPDVFTSVIAHEPAIDWTPDNVRFQLFPEEGISTYDGEFSGGTGGPGVIEQPLKITYNDMPVLYLFSTEWYKKNWGYNNQLQHLFQRGHLGPSGRFAVIDAAHHNEFSDMCFLTPLWLARALNVTGARNPIDTATEISAKTLDFLRSAGVCTAM